MSLFWTDEPGDSPDRDGWSRERGIRRWPLHWEGLYPREQWLWFEQLWSDACALRKRYRLPLRSAWWTDQLQVESLAAVWIGMIPSAGSSVPASTSAPPSSPTEAPIVTQGAPVAVRAADGGGRRPNSRAE